MGTPAPPHAACGVSPFIGVPDQGAQHMPQMAQLVDFMRFQVYGAAPAAVRAPKWAAVGRLGRVVRGVRDGGRGWLLACLPACVCLGLDVSALGPSGVWLVPVSV